MDENKEFEMEREQLQPEMDFSAPECREEVTPDAAENPASVYNHAQSEEAQYEPESVPLTTYRGAGAGRRESPFADSPYVVNHPPRTEEPYRPRYQTVSAEKPAPKKKRKGGFVKKLLSWVAVAALVIGSCAVTAEIVNDRWEDRVEALEESFDSQLAALQQQVQAMAPASTGNSVSGTVTVGNGMTAAQVYAKNVQSVVLIEATVTTEFFGQSSSGMSAGSGFVLTENGYVVTNFHVVEGASSVDVVLYDGTSHSASLVGYDQTNDLAVLKVEAEGLSPVELGSSDDLIVGDQVVAIGNPLGELTATLTVGYVSAKERTVNTDGTVITMIQTDAAINSGNSGGPLFNMKGQVVGITTAKYSGASSSGASIEGIGFAIPMSDVQEGIRELIDFGYIKSAYLGVMVQNMDPSVASIYSLPVGAYVASVEDGYCAQRAGIQAKDIIIAINDETVESINDLTRILRRHEPGEVVTLSVYRGGQVLEIQVTLDERPASAG